MTGQSAGSRPPARPSLRRRTHFAPIHDELLYSDLSDRAFRLWVLLDRQVSAEDDGAVSLAELGQHLDCSALSVDKAMRELARGGWLDIHRVAGARTRYVVHAEPPEVTG